MHTITASHHARVEAEWSRYAGEPVKVDPGLVGQPIVGATITAYGSELACLRLHYRLCCGRVAYSENLSTWYYVKE